jgi:hypothetical protein
MNKLRKTKKRKHGGTHRPPNANYKENLLVAAGVDTSLGIDKEKAKAFLLEALKKSFYDFKDRKQHNSEKNIFSDDEKARMLKLYRTFMYDVNHNHRLKKDFRIKNNTICFFLAMLFQQYMMKNPYYVEKMGAMKANIFSKIKERDENDKHDNGFPWTKEIETVPSSVSGIQEYINRQKEKDEYNKLFTDKKYFIRLHGSSLETILTAFTKDVFFVGFENKEVITHNGILLPFAYIYHDLLHYSSFVKNYNIVNVNLLTQFLNFIKNKQNSYHVYFILYLCMFESQCVGFQTVETLLSEKIPLIEKSINPNSALLSFYQDCICAFLRFDISKNHFDFIMERLVKYNRKYKYHNYEKVEDLVSEHFLLSLLPEDVKTDVTNEPNEKKKRQVINIYMYKCILTFFKYYEAFMFPLSMPLSFQNMLPLSQKPTPSTPAKTTEATSNMHLLDLIKNNYEEQVQLECQKKGKDIDFKDENGKTALMHAVSTGNSNIIEILLLANANVDLKDKDGKTALMHVSELGDFEKPDDEKIIKLLVDTGRANKDLKDEYGKTALMYAAKNPTANGNICGILGGTVTYTASIIESVYRTFSGKAKNVDVQDHDGKTAFMHSCDSVIKLEFEEPEFYKSIHNITSFNHHLQRYEPNLTLKDRNGKTGRQYLEEAQKKIKYFQKLEEIKEIKELENFAEQEGIEYTKDNQSGELTRINGGNRIITTRKRVEKRKKRNTYQSRRFECAKM